MTHVKAVRYITAHVKNGTCKYRIYIQSKEHFEQTLWTQLGSKFYAQYTFFMPVPVAARSKAWVCGRSPSETVGLNPTGGMDVCRECCVLSSRGLCDELITRPEDSCRLGCVVVYDLETS